MQKFTESSADLMRLLALPANHIRAVDAALQAVYGQPHLRPDHDPLGGLIATILSQNTSDLNSSRAYANLRLRFPTWKLVMAATHQDVAAAIHSAGISSVKATRIQEVLARVERDYGRLSLEALAGMNVPEARALLSSFHGVGPKTASCVLLFNLGMPAFPVDTHVQRLSLRLGFARSSSSPAQIQDQVEAVIAPDRAYPLHVNLITHGRRVCKAQRPRCDTCAIRPLCRFGTVSAFSAVANGMEA